MIIIGLVIPEMLRLISFGPSEPPEVEIQIGSIGRDADGAVTIYVQNVGDDVAVLSSVYVDDVLNAPVTPLPVTLNTDQTVEIFLSGNYSGLTQVTVKVLTSEGNVYQFTKTFAD